MQTPTFRRIAAGHHIDDASGVEIIQGDSRRWFVYTVVPGFQSRNLAATRATLAQAKVAAKAEIAKLAVRREVDHAEAAAMAQARIDVLARNHPPLCTGCAYEDAVKAMNAERTITITIPLTHAETVDRLRDYAQEHEVPYDRLEFAIMAVTGVTAEGAYALIFADSTASLADLH